LPPRIEREPEPEPPPPPPVAPPAPEPEISSTQADTVYRPRHARTDAEPDEDEDFEPEDDEDFEPEDDEDIEPDEDEDEGFEPVDDPVPQPVAAGPVAGPAGVAPAPRPVPPGARRPPSTTSTVRDAVRPHMRFLSVILVVLVVLGGGYFALRVHHRISQSSLEHQITDRDRAQNVRCSALQSNGSAWACAVVFRAEAECLIARVNVLGSWSTVVRTRRCAKIAELVALLPERITPDGVAADVGQQLGIAGLTCRKVPQHEVRWACGSPPAPGGQCLVVRDVGWQTWPVQAGGRLCDHFPALETAIRASQGEA
jgi:hypothetical protein